MVSYRVIGKPTPTDVDGKATGATQFTADVRLPGMLWGEVLRSPFSHARILRIDTSKAARLPGVHAVLTGDDVRGIRYGRRYKDVPVLAQDVVRYIGERVAAVAAEDAATATAAAALIEVDYEELPAVFDPLEAMRDDAPLLHPDVNSYEGLPEPVDPPSNAYVRDVTTKGDVDAGFAASDIVVENEFTVSRTHQAYMEPHACIAWEDGAGKLQVWSATKAPHGLKQTLAAALGRDPDTICVNPVAIGGDFGGKGAALDEPLCCFLALRAGRPVKMVMAYTDELTAAAPRHAGVLRLKTGVKRDGTLIAHQTQVIFDGGAYGGLRPGANLAGAGHSAGFYRIPNAHIETMRVYTNNLPGGQMRAPGSPQGFFAAESHMDCVARAIGMDPLEFRLKNLITDGEETIEGDRYRGIRALETLQAAVAEAGYAEPKAPGVGRGIAMGFRSPGGGESAIAVSMHADGRVVVGTSVFEQGTGTYTTLRQCVAEELSMSPAGITMDVLDTDAMPFDSGIGGSRGTNIGAGSAFQAGGEAREEMLGLAADVLEWPREQLSLDGPDVVRGDTGDRRPWTAVLVRAGHGVRVEAVHKTEGRSPVTAFTAQVAEVSVDPETGAVKLLRFTTAHDVGTVLNPIGHQGQINGAVVQGIGYGLMEEVTVENGRVTTTSFADFKIPTIEDLPGELRTVLLEPAEGVGPYSIKGIGENPNPPVAPAIANAVEDAVGVRVRSLPITAEKVYRALHG